MFPILPLRVMLRELSKLHRLAAVQLGVVMRREPKHRE